MHWCAEHSPGHCDAGERVQGECAVGMHGLRPRGNVGVELGDAGHQELATPIDRGCAGRGGARSADVSDPPVFDNDGLVREHFLTIHRNDRHAGDRDGRLGALGGSRRCKRESGAGDGDGKGHAT